MQNVLVTSNDAGFAFGFTESSCLKVDLPRTNAPVFGARYLFDSVVSGGASAELIAGLSTDELF